MTTLPKIDNVMTACDTYCLRSVCYKWKCVGYIKDLIMIRTLLSVMYLYHNDILAGKMCTIWIDICLSLLKDCVEDYYYMGYRKLFGKIAH